MAGGRSVRHAVSLPRWRLQVVGLRQSPAATPPGAAGRRVLLREYASGRLRYDDAWVLRPYPDLVNDKLTAWWHRYQTSSMRGAVSAVAIAAVLLVGSYGEAHPGQSSDKVQNGHPVPHTPNAALLLVAVACLVLAWRRRYPLTVLAVSTAAVVTYSALGYVNGAVLLAPAVALFAVARQVPQRRSILAAVATMIALGTATVAANPFGPLGGGALLIPALIAGPLFGGIAIRNRHAYVTSIQARADEEAKRRVDEERLRIARELHDIVAHTMATISVQAGVAEHVLADNPAAAGDALRVIKAASKDGLRELRAILNVLRQADEVDPTQPAPGLAQLDALVAGACNAGLPTTLTQTGEPQLLPPAVELAAYRIVQESLTNVIKHAGPARAMVGVSYGAGALRIEVSDTGGGPSALPLAGATGHGIIGMRERASSVGGTLEAGPGPAGGYRVTALLPADGRLAADVANPESGAPLGAESARAGRVTPS
jgi:signal transduction histidine kinase